MPLYCQALIGQQSAAFTSFNFSGVSTQNEVCDATAGVMPFAGRLRRLWAFFAGDGVTVTARCVAWLTATLAVGSKSPQFTAPSGTHATGGQTLNNQITDGADTPVGFGVGYLFGWWRLPSASSVWSILGSGNYDWTSQTGSTDVGPITLNAAAGHVEAFALVTGIATHTDYGFQGVAMRKKRRR